MFSVIMEHVHNGSSAAEEPASKRQRLCADSGLDSTSTAFRASRLPSAFHLLHTKGIADQANEYVRICRHALPIAASHRYVCI